MQVKHIESSHASRELKKGKIAYCGAVIADAEPRFGNAEYGVRAIQDGRSEVCPDCCLALAGIVKPDPAEQPADVSGEPKVLTFTLNSNSGGGPLISDSPEGILETLKTELEGIETVFDDEGFEYTITVDKSMTKTEIDNLPDWNGF